MGGGTDAPILLFIFPTHTSINLDCWPRVKEGKSVPILLHEKQQTSKSQQFPRSFQCVVLGALFCSQQQTSTYQCLLQFNFESCNETQFLDQVPLKLVRLILKYNLLIYFIYTSLFSPMATQSGFHCSPLLHFILVTIL